MSTVTIEEAQANLPRLIEELSPGEEVVKAERTTWPCQAGSFRKAEF
jgi:antitoxin (DNA-binding transcriptional repressor) of toxin-antitoxin stability system